MRAALNTVLFLMLLFNKFAPSILAAVTYWKRTCTLVKIQTFALVIFNTYVFDFQLNRLRMPQLLL